MEHLDLAGVLTSASHWTMPGFDQQDAIYLSTSRQMLEPIMEETSEDEEHAQNSWNTYEHTHNFWSSAESETGSVIRIEVTKDADSISERDFACPAKRARRCDEFTVAASITPPQLNQPQQQQSLLHVSRSFDDTVLLRKYQRYIDTAEPHNSLERFLCYDVAATRDSYGSQQRHSTGSRRFDDFYSDSDSLSYNSLSRSSSLIQFESLERQLLLQEQHVSSNSLGNSSPSLLSFDNPTVEEGARSGGNSGCNSGNNSRRGSQCSLLKRLESSDGRLHQTYFDLDKLNFDDELQQQQQQHVSFRTSKTLHIEATIGEIKSDSESSTSSAGSSAHSMRTASKPSTDDLSETNGSSRHAIQHCQQRGVKNSAENLSEDSGYCEPSTLRRSKSKSIPNNFEKFCEEEEEFQQQQQQQQQQQSTPTQLQCETERCLLAQNIHSKNSKLIHYSRTEHDICQPKINDATFIVESEEMATTEVVVASTMPELPESPETLDSSACHYYDDDDDEADGDHVKNSPTRELLLEQRRSLAHSPSPVSSDISGSSSSRTTRSSSSASASTCASAASFTWLPIELQRQTQSPQDEMPQPRATLGEFRALLRNSLPDIRDALSTETFYNCERLNGYGLERKQATRSSAAAAVVADDSDISDTATSIASTLDGRLSSDVTDVENILKRDRYDSAENDNHSRGGGGGGGGGGGDNDNISAICERGRYGNRARISSVPNELDKLGRKKRTSKSKYSKTTANSTGGSNSSSSDDDCDYFADSCMRIRRSCSWSGRRAIGKKQRNFEDAFGNFSSETEEETIVPRTQRRPLQSQLCGYMNASYQDLTQLDYSGTQPSNNSSYQKHYKRGIMEQRKSLSGEYEGIICKGNFLLDELSEIYDKNVSILNDKRMEQLDEVPELEESSPPSDAVPLSPVLENSRSPLPPPRHRRHSNSSHSDLETTVPEVQHVQLTIRKPPARQKQLRKSEVTNSLINELPTSFSTFGKTFDQDPTNLRTSYAQSLEKCNFDARELSNTDLTKVRSLPKRRFQSQATATKKRNLVSSTPNLNAFEADADEIEDDIFVSSAHTSMHQLPQTTTQKPLGILLPAGSRSSFGKEVSFCPIVSKYSWQEQSSEECNEPVTPDLQQQQQQQQLEQEHQQEKQQEPKGMAATAEDSDDELLDNADATVIYNTKENEMIAMRYKEEQAAKSASVLRAQIQMPATESVRVTLVGKAESTERQEHDHTSNEESDEERAIEKSMKEQKTSQTTKTPATKLVSNDTTFNETAAVAVSDTTFTGEAHRIESTFAEHTTENNAATSSDNDRTSHHEFTKRNNAQHGQNVTQQTRPFSLTLPILSEPPINRAHHILYASQQLLDDFQRREQASLNEQQPPLSRNMANYGVKCSEKEFVGGGTSAGTAAVRPAHNNNNELVKSKFKADEKHPNSKGFLSRFAHGFRFSLRRNKKKQLQQQQQLTAEQQQQQQQQQQQLQQHSNGNNNNKANGVPKTGKADFIYIPLKGPLPAKHSTSGNSVSGNDSSSGQIGAKTAGKQQTKVTGKPPLPKQPPRIVAQSAGSHAQNAVKPTATATNFRALSQSQPQHQQQQKHTQKPAKSQSQFYTDADFLDAERSYYADFTPQLNTGMQANGCAAVRAPIVGANAGTGATLPVDSIPVEEFASPSRATVSQKTQMFNNLGGGGGVYIKHKHNNNNNSHNHNNCKIGLIETNLDTHETVISGKTRSLVDIGPQHLSTVSGTGNKRYGVKRLNLNAGGHSSVGMGGGTDNGDDDDDDVYVVDMGAGGINDGVVLKSTTQSGGQIASVRRPHKSMEFLLDKENQKNVLPPENELQKSHDHNPAALSEHQLRVQASLQRLNIPDWFRQYNQNTSRSPEGAGGGSSVYKPGNFTRKRTTESGRWAGLNSKTTSLSSLGSQRSDRSPLLLSPSAHSHHGVQAGAAHVHQHGTNVGTSAYGTGAGAFSRWSTSHLNSSQTSPSVSQRGSFTRGGAVNSSFMSVASGNSGVIRNSFRQPYLGWRSQEKLSQRTPHERLASSLLAQQQRISPTQRTPGNINGLNDKLQPVTPEIQTSIKEVTSAIVHYVNDQTNQQRSRSTSPNSRKCWLESSFVGIRPLDSPQTPVIENTAGVTTFSTAAVAAPYLNNNNNNINSTAFYLHNRIIANQQPTTLTTSTTTTAPTAADVLLRMNGLSSVGGCAPERSLSTASLEDVLASLLGLPSTSAGAGASTSDAYARSTTGDLASQTQLSTFRHMPQQVQPQSLPQQQQQQQQQSQLQVNLLAEQQRLRRRSEGDAPAQKQQQQNQQQEQQQQQQPNPTQQQSSTIQQIQQTTVPSSTTISNQNAKSNPNTIDGALPARRVSLGDSSESNNKTTSELQIKCRNTKCDRSATPADAKKYYKSCHNCTHLYCSRECRRAHWEKHRKACLHSRASNLCRQVLATCKDDLDSQRHLSLLARKGFLSQGRGVVRVLFRSAEAAEGFIKHGFQCMGEASYVRWPDLMPAEMGLELYSELLKLSTEYKPDSKMLIYVAICVVSEAPGMGQAPVRWERQLVSRCAKLKLCKTILAELEQQQQALQQPLAVVAVPEPTTEILILTFNPSIRASTTQRDLILSNILDILSRRGVLLRKHYPEIYQRLQSYTDGQTDKFNPVTLHPRDSQTGQSFVCIIMPVHSDSEIIKLPSAADGGNRVTTIDVGSPAALAQLDDDELLTRSTS